MASASRDEVQRVRAPSGVRPDETVAYLRAPTASGTRLPGASDPAFKTINVLPDR
jgi:hypothetical protein